jgi:PAS domain S-box-containing protein
LIVEIFPGTEGGFCVTSLRTDYRFGLGGYVPTNDQEVDLLRSIAEGVSTTTGEAFFRLLVQNLCKALKTDFACVSELDFGNPDRLRAFAFYGGDKFFDEVAYELAGTPCGEALASGRALYPCNVQSSFPQDYQLREMGVQSYLGVALTGSNRQPLGILSVMSLSPMENAGPAETILNIFASRVSPELERRRAEAQLQETQRFSQRIAETTPNVLFVYDLIERRNVYSNDRSIDILGYTPEEISDMGENFLTRLLHPDDLAHLQTLGAEYAGRRDGEIFEHVFRIRHKNGQWRWVQRMATIFSRTPDGRPKQILGSVTDITGFKDSERELQELSARLLDIQDEERRRIARELHDVTGQNLTAIGLNLTVLERSSTLDQASRSILLECQRLCEESKQEIRTLSYLLHPPMLDQFGLIGALEWYINGLKQRAKLNVSLKIEPDIGRFPMDLETDLFRVVQEGLTNILRYSGSETAVIRLEKRETDLVLNIQDQGRGLPAKARRDIHGNEVTFGVGIPAMRERLRQHGGALEVHSNGEGTTITAVVPLPRATPPATP